jgi:murein DD-endopeptidase MepM/ murein hydrolase activator NlpD
VGFEFVLGVDQTEGAQLRELQADRRGIEVADEAVEVLAVQNGTVTEVITDDGEKGKVIRIEHDNGLETVYASLGSIDVVKGQSVKAGDKIGMTGNSAVWEKFDMPVVRLETYENGKPINADKYLTFPVIEK